MSAGPYGFEPDYYVGGPTGVTEIQFATYAVMLLLFFVSFKRGNSARTAWLRALAGASFATLLVALLAFIVDFDAQEALGIAIGLLLVSGLAAALLLFARIPSGNRSHG